MNYLKVVLISFISIITVLGVSCFGLYSYYYNEINRTIKINDSDKISLSLSIKKGSSVEAISQYLKENKLIDNPTILKAYLYLNSDKKIQAGYYKINETNLNLVKLVDLLQKGSFQQKLTFIEGWRIEEYKDYLTKEMGSDYAASFMASSQIKEGYMFPDTYIIDSDYPADKLALWMRQTFDKKIAPLNIDEKAMQKNLSADQVLVLASILEREMHIQKDRPVVASILVKRYQENWAIQADATVQYAKGNANDWWPIVTSDDLKNIDSPYNSYLNKELPPKPICNPSLSSIKAILDASDTPYWFYITGNDGVTYYAATLEEHNNNIAKYLR